MNSKKAILWMFVSSVVVISGLEAFSVNLPPKISLKVPEEISVEGRQIPLYVIIDHTGKDSIDINSFQIDGKTLTVERIEKKNIAPESLYKGDDSDEELLVSTYRASLPQKKAGVYVIGPVTVAVGGIPYSSSTITLQVQGAVVSNDFRLEATIHSPPKIFPGQTVVFEYDIFFKGSMQLLLEDLPLLNVQGFLNVGSPEITTSVVSDGNVQTIKQRAKAISPGAYEVGVSTIEGMVVDSSSGSVRSVPPLYRSQVPSRNITIASFPVDGKPPIFDGALGSFEWRGRILGDETVPIGEPVRIEYRVSGQGELSTVQFPSYDRLAGLSESFWTDSNPPLGEVGEGTVQFLVVLRPKRLGEVEVPGFFAASFDPFSGQYVTDSVAPIKLIVEGSKETEAELIKKAPVSGQGLRPFELDSSTVSVRTLSSIWIVVALIFALVLGMAQYFLWRYWRQRQENTQVTSRDLFIKAVMNRSSREKGLGLLRQALYVRLFELGLTPTTLDTPEAIVGEGVAAEVKTLIQQIDRQLYRKDEATSSIQEIYDEASALQYRMKQMEAPTRTPETR